MCVCVFAMTGSIWLMCSITRCHPSPCPHSRLPFVFCRLISLPSYLFFCPLFQPSPVFFTPAHSRSPSVCALSPSGDGESAQSRVPPAAENAKGLSHAARGHASRCRQPSGRMFNAPVREGRLAESAQCRGKKKSPTGRDLCHLY